MKKITLMTPLSPRRLATPAHGSRAWLAVCASVLVTGTAFATPSTSVVISQVYGGGGGSSEPSATYKNSFIELHNISNGTVSLVGWRIQFTFAAGSDWSGNGVNLSGSIPAGAYFLIRLDGAGTAGADLPTHDLTGDFGLPPAAGKVALTNTTEILTGANPSSGATVVDFVGYGSATGYETATAPAGSNVNSLTRKDFGSTDTDNNSSDFTVGVASARNSSSPPYFSNNYAAWALTNTGSSSTSATGDHDNDGVSNGVEFFSGATGSTFTPSPVPDANRLLSFPASATATGVTGIIQTSPDLVTWTLLPSTTASGFISATIPQPDAGGKIFARLNVVVAP